MKNKISTLKSKLAQGVLPAMATPLDDSGYRVNTAVIPTLIEFLINKGAQGLFVGGTTGEGILLTSEERMRLHKTAVTTIGDRVPIILHVGANRIDTAVALAQHASTIGCDAIAAVTPYYYDIHDEALADYYFAIAAAVPDVPLLLYDIPHLAGNSISPQLLIRLSQKIPSLAGIKISQQNALLVRQLLDATPDHLIALVGNERLILGLLAMRADGLISGTSTAVPEPFVALTQAFAANDLHKAQQIQLQINQFLDLFPAGERIGAIKSILNERGIAVGTAMPPRPMPTENLWSQIQSIGVM